MNTAASASSCAPDAACTTSFGPPLQSDRRAERHGRGPAAGSENDDDTRQGLSRGDVIGGCRVYELTCRQGRACDEGEQEQAAHEDLTVAGSTGSPGPRAKRADVTHDFELVWRDVDVPLRRYLASLGALRHEIDDLVQEVALRALERNVPYDDAADLRRWCFVVARRLRIDEVRRHARHVPQGPDRPDLRAMDQLVQVEHRHLLGTVVHHLRAMRSQDQQALRDVPGSSDEQARNRARVARHRARTRLLQAVGPLGVALGLLPSTHRAVRGPAAKLTLASAIPVFVVAALHGPSTPPLELRPDSSQATSGSAASRAAVSDASAGMSTASAPTRRGTQLRAARPSATGPRAHEVIGARAPNGTFVSVRLEQNTPARPMLCVDPSIGSALCLDKPRNASRILPKSWL